MMNRSQVLNRRLRTKYTVEERKEKLRQCAAEVSHECMLRLLFRYRLRVSILDEKKKSMNCCGALWKLVLDICSSMGLKSAAADDALNKYIERSDEKQEAIAASRGHLPGLNGVSGGGSVAENDADPSKDREILVTE